MASTSLTPETNGVRYGLFTGGAMMLYFLVASLFGLAEHIELSFLNGIIMVVGICMAIVQYKHYRHGRMPYLHGFGTGIITAAVASVAFSFFFVLYAGVLNRHIMDGIRAQDLFGFDLSVTIAFLAIILQGTMSGVIISLIAMQHYKSPDHKPLTGLE